MNALYRQIATRRNRPQLPRNLLPTRRLRPHGQQPGIRRIQALRLRAHHALRRQRPHLHRDPRLPLADLPPRLHRHGRPRGAEARGPSRQEDRRAALHHDGRGVDPRAAGAAGRRHVARAAGRRRDGDAAGPRSAQRLAHAETGLDREESERQIAELAARGRQDRRPISAACEAPVS